jgi:hypothetical protein
MYENGVPVEIGGKPHTLVFTLAAMLMMSERYGGMDELGELLTGPETEETDDEAEKARKLAEQRKARLRAMQETPWLIATLANQGALLENSALKPGDPELLTPEQVALQVPPYRLGELSAALTKAIRIGMNTQHDTDENEETDVVLEELERKNAAGAAE